MFKSLFTAVILQTHYRSFIKLFRYRILNINFAHQSRYYKNCRGRSTHFTERESTHSCDSKVLNLIYPETLLTRSAYHAANCGVQSESLRSDVHTHKNLRESCEKFNWCHD
jgi:hypothetical protein